jgi:hypothetical protein
MARKKINKPEPVAAPVETIGRKWQLLNSELRMATEAECLELLRLEQTRAPLRITYLLRIHGRFNVLRAQRERNALLQGELDTSKLGGS